MCGMRGMGDSLHKVLVRIECVFALPPEMGRRGRKAHVFVDEWHDSLVAQVAVECKPISRVIIGYQNIVLDHALEAQYGF